MLCESPKAAGRELYTQGDFHCKSPKLELAGVSLFSNILEVREKNLEVENELCSTGPFFFCFLFGMEPLVTKSQGGGG